MEDRRNSEFAMTAVQALVCVGVRPLQMRDCNSHIGTRLACLSGSRARADEASNNPAAIGIKNDRSHGGVINANDMSRESPVTMAQQTD
jgi:hypothetical protein